MDLDKFLVVNNISYSSYEHRKLSMISYRADELLFGQRVSNTRLPAMFVTVYVAKTHSKHMNCRLPCH